MAHTLRRSRSKYGRTRRQRRKQRRIRGGGIFDEIINKFKPSTPEEKCAKAKELAQEACSNNNAEGDIEMMPMDIDSDSLNPDVAAVDTTTTPPPIPSNTDRQLGDNNEEGVKLDTIIPGSDMSTGSDSYNMQDGTDSRMTAAPQNDMSGMSGMSSPDNSGEMGTDQNQTPSPLIPLAPQYQPQTARFSGGAKKSKKNNKKRSQSRRKKLKSRKHKK
jgi:hypothetical protein